MSFPAKLNTFNDPIYGFITIPDGIVFQLVQHPFFQRLRRISQMGMSYLVYPGAHHTRFHHALGCVHLMQKAVHILRLKGVIISDDEEEALYIAILLHDIGHGPFSHAMENSIVNRVSHEAISLKFMEQLNRDFNERLTLAINIFKGVHDKKFLCQLISGQLDIDRLDYLRRDSFYAGTPEGSINTERLISMLNVTGNHLVVEEKGRFSVEKFLIARRFMYWQVYLHKTGVVAEQLLAKVLQRAKQLAAQGVVLPASDALQYFLREEVGRDNFDAKTLETFARLDDSDILAALKSWQFSDDFVLSNLSDRLLNRRLLKIELSDKPLPSEKLQKRQRVFAAENGISEAEAAYFVFGGVISNRAYDASSDIIELLSHNGKTTDLAQAAGQAYIVSLTTDEVRYFVCGPKK